MIELFARKTAPGWDSWGDEVTAPGWDSWGDEVEGGETE
jgi:N6-adenosine-specific RNA methylase IME4